MNWKITLTTQEKTMNMAKLGIVSRAGNYFHSLGKRQKQRACGLMRYTLCVFKDKARRNGSRYGFAFYILPISGLTPLSAGWLSRLAAKVAVLVPLQLILISESHGHDTKTHSKSFWLWLTGRFLGLNNYSGSRYGYGHQVTPTKNGFSLSMGGCHE